MTGYTYLMNNESKAKQITVKATYASGKKVTVAKMRPGVTREQAMGWALDNLTGAKGYEITEA